MYDIIIIGAGTAGISAYKEAVKYTSNLLIINKGPWDTTCVRVGCMPSKVLISTANRMHDIQHADEVALSVQSEINTDRVMQHVQNLRDRFARATLKDVESWEEKHKIDGEAKFINAHTVEVNGQQYQAKILGINSSHPMKSFELKTLPKSIAVIGSGVIAIELAQAMHRLGVNTTIFARSKKVGVLTSPSLQAIAQTTLSKELDIKFEILPNSIEDTEHGVAVSFLENDESNTIQVDYVLTATGRSSNLSTLALENIDASFSDLKNLPIHQATKQLANFPIFIVGDAFTQTPLQHEAAHEGRNVVSSCLNFPKIQDLNTLAPLGIVFCSPEMGMVGQNYAALSKSNIEFITGFVSYEKQGRALVLGKNKGAIEVYVDKKTRKLLGAELFVESAEHMAHLLSWMIAEDLTIDEILSKPFYHPTLEEGIRTALKHARRQLNLR
ncbi:hypothetical protein FQR65_LT18932 [Abscondita terminalis]|nr:hypothetical protein FQR65_LT18932 [Abscondita terminalis]